MFDRPRARRFIPSACLALTACGAPPGAADAGAGAPPYDAPAPPTCPSPDEAPLRRSDGSRRCERMGAAPPAADGRWPDAAGAQPPLIYVGAEAPPAGAVGAPSIASALDAAPATILVGRGMFRLDATLDVRRSVVIRGVGAGATVLVGPAAGPALQVSSEEAPQTVFVEALELRFDPEARAAPALLVRGAGARLMLRDVAVLRGGDGLRAEGGATVCADGFAVRQAAGSGIVLSSGSDGWLRNVLVRGSAQVGIFADHAHVDIEGALVAESGRDGVALLGVRTGAPCAGSDECAPAPSCAPLRTSLAAPAQECVRSPPGTGPVLSLPTAERRCRAVDHLSDVALLRNHVTGLRAERVAVPAPDGGADADVTERYLRLAEPGPLVHASRLVIAETAVAAGLVGGDGLYVGPGARVVLDPDVARDAGPEREGEYLGRRSEIVYNVRGGVLVNGDPSTTGPDRIPVDLVQHGALDVGGARIASNGGPGLFVQRSAEVSALAFTSVVDNRSIGVGAASGGQLSLLLCDQFLYTRMGALALEGGPVMLGDGLSMAEGVAARGAAISACEFSQNARFGAIFSGYDATFNGSRNRGAGNLYGVGPYAEVRGDFSRILGRVEAPAFERAARGSVSPGP